MQEQLSARLREGKIAELIADDQVGAHQMFGQSPGAPGTSLGFQHVDQIPEVEEAAMGPVANDRTRDGD